MVTQSQFLPDNKTNQSTDNVTIVIKLSRNPTFDHQQKINGTQGYWNHKAFKKKCNHSGKCQQSTQHAQWLFYQ